LPPELAEMDDKGNKLSAKELRAPARQLAEAPDEAAAARIRERITRGFYGGHGIAGRPWITASAPA
jgi:hypothetical protein